MSAVLHSIVLSGMSGLVIDVECHMSNGLPALLIVGLANRSVDEAKERIRSAFASSQLNFPRKRITINLAPADIPKDSTMFDLAIATAILVSSQQTKPLPPGVMVLGELGLDGDVKAVRGLIGVLLAARQLGYHTFYIPSVHYTQSLLVPDIQVIPVPNLTSLYLDLTGSVPLKRTATGDGTLSGQSKRPIKTSDFSHISGQSRAKRALEIAAAGNHNVLLCGPPGTGKSMLANALPSILPPLNAYEMLEITHLHSLASHHYDGILAERPFRAPHHSASSISVIGGGQVPRPGEISLSHRGVLFFDEFPEFSRTTIEALRQPLEDKVITITRARDSITFPADFMLVATANPCPCGYYGTSKTCSCAPYEIHKYHKKLSGPVLDRIDIYVDVDDIKHEQLLTNALEASSNSIRQRVMAARRRQQLRNRPAFKANANLKNEDIKRYGQLTEASAAFLNQAAGQLNISARAYMRTIKVARTIADLDSAEAILPAHVAEALQYRKKPLA